MERAYIGIDGLIKVNYDSFAKRLFTIDELEAPVERVVRVLGGLDWWVTLNARNRSLLDAAINKVNDAALNAAFELSGGVKTGNKIPDIYVLQIKPDMDYRREPQIGLQAANFLKGGYPLMAYMAVTIDKAHPKGTAEDVVKQLKEVKGIGDIAVIVDGVKVVIGVDPHDIMTVVGGYRDDIEDIVINHVQKMEGVSQTRTYFWAVPSRRKSG